MKFNVIRAWKDEAYRQSLSAEELSMLPESPVGATELTDVDLQVVHGGKDVGDVFSIAACSAAACNTNIVAAAAIFSDSECSFKL